MAKYNYVIVGGGLFGAVTAEQLTKKGNSVLLLERRDHVGGNCYTYNDEETGINIHKYGTHIFHTNNREIWEYINQFSDFNRYQHRVLTTYEGKVYTMPINLGTINAFYNSNLKPSEVEAFIATKRSGVENPANLEEKAISLIGKDLYDAFIKGYTIKQWGCDPRELPANIITRLPVRYSYYDSYFDDTYQGVPVGGYTPIFERMLEGIPVELNVDYFADRAYWERQCDRLVYTAPIDRYFDYQFGRLNWRSVRFEVESLAVDDFQGTSQMNYADLKVPYTRIHEPKHLHPEKKHRPGKTVISREYSQIDNDAPYYPVNSEADKQRLASYQELARRERTVFGGRLAEYKYYDMHQVVGSALALCRKLN